LPTLLLPDGRSGQSRFHTSNAPCTPVIRVDDGNGVYLPRRLVFSYVFRHGSRSVRAGNTCRNGDGTRGRRAMSTFSRHVAHATCAQVIHPWSDDCSRAYRMMIRSSATGSCRLFVPIMLVSERVRRDVVARSRVVFFVSLHTPFPRPFTLLNCPLDNGYAWQKKKKKNRRFGRQLRFQ